FAAQKYGLENLPFKYKMLGAFIYLFRKINMDKMVAIYGKYIGNWGGTANAWKFEAYKNGKPVKTLVVCPGGNASLRVDVSRTSLVEENTYDVCPLRFSAVDENGNLQPYFQEAVSLRCEGDVELIGPSAVSFKGGLSGCYVKSKGKSGSGKLVITDWNGKEMSVEFKVSLGCGNA
ncbi:MAG: glycoside hydrolase family 2 protein, partial [Treponema sp.]|nr:glycoside hydrolase family 2 protein [Treponema sp.]